MLKFMAPNIHCTSKHSIIPKSAEDKAPMDDELKIMSEVITYLTHERYSKLQLYLT